MLCMIGVYLSNITNTVFFNFAFECESCEHLLFLFIGTGDGGWGKLGGLLASQSSQKSHILKYSVIKKSQKELVIVI